MKGVTLILVIGQFIIVRKKIGISNKIILINDSYKSLTSVRPTLVRDFFVMLIINFYKKIKINFDETFLIKLKSNSYNWGGEVYGKKGTNTFG